VSQAGRDRGKLTGALFANENVVRFLAQNFREFLAKFQRIADSTALEK
jgi:hypothetical protein